MRRGFWLVLCLLVRISPVFAEKEPQSAAESAGITGEAAQATPSPVELPPKDVSVESKPSLASEDKSKSDEIAPAPLPPPETMQKSPEKQNPAVFSEVHLIAGGGLSLNQSFSSIIGLGWGGLAFTRFEYDRFSLAVSAETGLYNSKASKLETSQYTINLEKGQSIGYTNFGLAGGYRVFEWQGFAFGLGFGAGYTILSASSAILSRNFFVQAFPEVWYTPWPRVKVVLRTAMYYTFVNEPEVDGKKFPLLAVVNVIDARIQMLAAYSIF